MHRELTIRTAEREHKVFLQNGFYGLVADKTPLHYHTYAEVHLIYGGHAVMRSGREDILLDSGDLLVIPAGTYHTLARRDENVRHTAFQIDAHIEKNMRFSLPSAILSDFFQKIDKCAEDKDHTDIAAYVTFLCFSLWGKESVSLKPTVDRNILIREFFSTNYNRDVHLCDLARELHLSERQTERLVTELTGNTFQRELTLARLNMADILMQSTELSMTEIASYVGYKSYAGFWKAMRAGGITGNK